MRKRSRKFLILGMLVLFVVVAGAIGLKYFPFTKIMKMPVAPEKEFVNPQKTRIMSPNTLFYDFEVAPGKEMPGGFYKGLAHSGKYSVKAFGQNSFSVAVERTAGEVGIENLQSIAVSAWVYVFPTDNEVKGHLVFTASNELGVNVCWQGAGLREPEVPRGKWFKISGFFNLSSVTFKPGYKLQVYFWNNSKTDILVDDYTIVFGGAADRRGDSALVDLTRPAGFTSRFNYPPFPVTFLEKENASKLPVPRDIGPADVIFTGNFLETGSDLLSVITPDGRMTVWANCGENEGFRRMAVLNASLIAPVIPVMNVFAGRFLDGNTDQILISGKKGSMLVSMAMQGKPCSGEGLLQVSLKSLWKSVPENIACTGDFNGDRKQEILKVAADGSWKILSFELPGKNGQGTWKTIAASGEPLKDWSGEGREIAFTAGKFIGSSAADQLLVISRSKTAGKSGYSLYTFDPAGIGWIPACKANQDHFGKTIGLDTLRPADKFFPVRIAGDHRAFLRYNRDWRFDLKMITFSDTAFAVHASCDFHGYELDHNPKYYESLRIIPLRNVNPAGSSFLVIGRNAAEHHCEAVLPDFISIYTLLNQNSRK